MKELTLSIPEKSYSAFLKLLKNKFSEIQIKNYPNLKVEGDYTQDDKDLLFFAEQNLAEDWNSDEDKRWDEVL